MRQIVLDASVVLKWFLVDEENGQNALDLLIKFVSNEIEILAPSLLEYEVINGLFIAQKRGRIKDEKLISAIEGFIDLEIKLKDLSHFYSKMMHYRKVYHCSTYDASYLALAEVEKIPMITSDRDMYNAVKKDLKWVKWLGDV